MGLIYRLEDHDGGGLYRGKVADMMEYHPLNEFDSEANHPSPGDDSLLIQGINERIEEHYGLFTLTHPEFVNNEGYYFCFGNVNQLRSWVYNDEWLKRFDDAGIWLSIYDVYDEHRIDGHSQAIFKRDRAILVSHVKSCEYFGIK